MTNQRAGKTHAAGMRDEGGGNITLKQLIGFCDQAENALSQAGDVDSALRFEIMGSWLRDDVANGRPFRYEDRALGL